MATETLDRLPEWPECFALQVVRTKAWSREWVVLVIDVEPEVFARWGGGKHREAWVRIPGRHKDRDAAWDALEGMAATRH